MQYRMVIPQQGEGKDCTEIINKALNQRTVLGACEIVLPSGRVLLSETICVEDAGGHPITIKGGFDTTIVGPVKSDTNFQAFDLTDTCNVVLADMVLENVFVLIGPSHSATLRNLFFKQGGVDIINRKEDDKPAYRWRIDGCFFDKCSPAIYVEGMGCDGVVENCTFTDNALCVEIMSDTKQETFASDGGDCPRVVFRRNNMELPSQSQAFHMTGTEMAPLIVDDLRIQGNGNFGKIGNCGRRYGHSLTRVSSTVGPLNIPSGLWVDAFGCDGLSFRTR